MSNPRQVTRIRRIRSTLLLAGAACIGACGGSDAADAARPDATLFEGARIIVGDGGDPIENGAFIVEDGQFTEVGVSGEVALPPGASRVDLTGQTVMPALINTHVHLGSTREEIIDQLERYAYYGVGTVQSLGLDSTAIALEMRGTPVAGAARYLTSGRGITAPEPGRNESPFWVTTEEEARAAVQTLAEQGIELVKIWVDDRNGQYEKLGPELYGAVIDEAHLHGMRVAAHIFALEDAKGLLEAGIDAFAHSVRDMAIDQEGLALFREHPEFFLIPNLPGSGGSQFEIQGPNLGMLNEAGTRIAMGTDGSSPPAAHQEMADMVAAGMTPAEVLVAATRTSAALLRLPDVGTIEVDKDADFVVLTANPLDEITNTEQIDAVYLRGLAVDREAIGARIAADQDEGGGRGGRGGL